VDKKKKRIMIKESGKLLIVAVALFVFVNLSLTAFCATSMIKDDTLYPEIKVGKVASIQFEGDKSGNCFLITGSEFSEPASPDIKITGEVERTNGVLTAIKRKTVIHIGQDAWRNYTSEFDLSLNPKANNLCIIRLAVLEKPHSWHYSEMDVDLKRDKTGALITIDTKVFNTQTRKHFVDLLTYHHKFAPTKENQVAKMKDRTVKAGSWYGRRLHLKIEQSDDYFRIWFEHRLVAEYRDPERSYGGFNVVLGKGDSISNLEVYSSNTDSSLFLPLGLDLYLNNDFSIKISSEKVKIDKIPFLLGKFGKNNNLFMKNAEWIEHKNDPSSYYGAFEQGEWFAGDPARPFFRIPSDDYTAIWLLAVTDKNKALSEDISLRIGKVSGQQHGMFRLYDFQSKIPRSDAKNGINVINTIKTDSGNLFLVRVPIGLALSQDFNNFMTLDLSKGLKLAVRQPDPARFRIRPLGLPSGVHLFGMTLERAPVKLSVSSPESGNVFNAPQQPYFTATMENRSGKRKQINLTATAKDSTGKEKVFRVKLSILPNETKSQLITFPPFQHGFYKLEVALSGNNDHKFLKRETTFALLPQDTRDRSARAPWGTWNFNGTHSTSKDIKKYGPLMRKLGIRFTLSSTDEKLARYGIRNNSSPKSKSKGCTKYAKKAIDKYPNMVKRGLIFHEDAISGAHVMRFPDCLLGRSPYKFNEKEQERFDMLWNNALDAGEEMRRECPDFKLQFGNGNPHLVEEFLRKGYPKKYLDVIGNENCGFMRPPEAQPDNVGFSTLWTFNEIMKYYGYDDIPLDICYEWMSRGTSPGNLTVEQQRDYYMRDALLGLAWGLRFINPGIITDASNGYYFSNWGSTGFCYGIPEMNPKPSYVGFAVLTQLLDGSTFKKALSTSSSSLYCLHFVTRQKQNIYALWTLRGERQVELKFSDNCSFKLTDWQDREKQMKSQDEVSAITVTTTPVFLNTTAKIEEVIAAQSIFDSKPSKNKKLINSMNNLSEWKIEKGKSLELETHNFNAPRRKGNFSFSNTPDFEGSGKCIRIKPNKPASGKPIQAMYEVMALKKPVLLKGKPKEIGLMVNGNSCWGRMIFELEDATGQRWISIGASQNGTPTRWMADWMSKEELEQVQNTSVADWNTNDSEARSAINFDGWRYLSFPLPGQYPVEDYHWPRNCYWKSDKDGIVHYPLKFTKLIIELREKVVYIKDMIKPSREDIYIKDLVVDE